MSSDPWAQLVLFVVVGGLVLAPVTLATLLLNLRSPTRLTVAWGAVVAAGCALSCLTETVRWLGPEITVGLMMAAAINGAAAYAGWRTLSLRP
jgi:uncharacterized membrane protein